LSVASEWYGVRCIFHHRDLRVYEERITLWEAPDGATAIARAEAEAIVYAHEHQDVDYLDIAQSFHMFAPPGDGAEAFSLMRSSELPPTEYLDRFFDTGAERQTDL
jgi:hypothetical protein